MVAPVPEFVTPAIGTPAPQATSAQPAGDSAAPERLTVAPLIVPESELEVPLNDASAPSTAEQAEGILANVFASLVAVTDVALQADSVLGVNLLDGSDGDSDADADAAPAVVPMLTFGDPATMDFGMDGLSPFASGLLANVAPFDPAVFGLAMRQIVGSVGDLGEEVAGALDGQGLFPPDRPRLLPWLVAAAVAACAYEVARRRQTERSQAGQALAGHGPTPMWFPGPPGR
jgi:hypothetical protein